MPETTWPEGVTARFLTVGTATVDITTNSRSVIATATCHGCGDRELFEIAPWNCSGGEEHAQAANAEYAANWAQGHAEMCRAMPKPTA